VSMKQMTAMSADRRVLDMSHHLSSLRARLQISRDMGFERTRTGGPLVTRRKRSHMRLAVCRFLVTHAKLSPVQ
jgi:hypothetical protein